MIMLIDSGLTPWLAILAEWSIRWALLISLLALWFSIRPPRSAASRYWLCAAVLGAGVLLPLLPRREVRWTTPAWAKARPTVKAAEVPTRLGSGVSRPALTTVASLLDSSTAAAGHVPDAVPLIEGELGFFAGLGTRGLMSLIVAIAWLTGAAVLLTRLVLGHFLLAMLRRTARDPSERARDVFARCREELRLKRRARLVQHPAIQSPIALGGRDALILVPPDWDCLSKTAQRACLFHELSHLARGDDVWKLARELVRVFFFFHPLVLWLLARLDYESERLCDAVALEQGIEPRELAETLLGFARRPFRIRPDAFATRAHVLAFLNRATVVHRISGLLEENPSQWMAPITQTRAAFLGLVVAVFALGIGSVNVRAVEGVPEQVRAAKVVVPAQTLPKRSLSGVVLDSRRRPVADALIVVGVVRPEPNHQTYKTGPDGRFSLPISAGPVLVDVITHKEGFEASAQRRWIPEEQSRVEGMELVLREAKPFAALLVDRQGRAAVGAKVRIETVAHSSSAPGETIGGSPSTIMTTWLMSFHEPIIRGTPLEDHFVTTTGQQGEFRFDALSAGAWLKLAAKVEGEGEMRVAAEAPPAEPGHEGFVNSAGGKPARLRLVASARVLGTIVSKVPGVSVAGLQIGLQDSYVPGGPRGSNNWKEAQTDDQGHFVVDGLNEGTANILLLQVPADGPFTYRAAADVQLTSDKTSEVQIELVEGVKVEGQVVGTDGVPIRDVEMGVHGPTHPRSGAAVMGTKTDKTGTYRLRLPSGENYIYVMGSAVGYRRPLHQGGRTVIIPENTKEFAVPTLELVPGVALKARIVDAAGVPVAGAKVIVVCKDDGGYPCKPTSVIADSTGSFRVSQHPSGGAFPIGEAVTLQVELPVGRHHQVTVNPTADGEVTVRLPVVLHQGKHGPG